jgi:hypothetical protein
MASNHTIDDDTTLEYEGPEANLKGDERADGPRRIDNKTRFSAGPSVLGPNGSNPNVLQGAGDFTLSRTTIHSGALSAVGGKQQIRIRRQKPAKKNVPVSPATYSDGTNLNPTVLSGFKGQLSQETFGSASFSAVGGYQDIRQHKPNQGWDQRSENTTIPTPSTPMNVLPNRDSFPCSSGGRYDDGQYSAVAGNRNNVPGSGGPSVLREFRQFDGHDLKFLPGSFSAVSEDQIVEYDGGENGST